MICIYYPKYLSKTKQYQLFINYQGSDLNKPASKSLEVARHILKVKGVVGIYSGLIPSITRAFLVSGSRFSVYEAILSLFK